jgi:hypothetical protein
MSDFLCTLPKFESGTALPPQGNRDKGGGCMATIIDPSKALMQIFGGFGVDIHQHLRLSEPTPPDVLDPGDKL